MHYKAITLYKKLTTLYAQSLDYVFYAAVMNFTPDVL